MGEIKARRLAQPVRCNPGTLVGDYVPFYFCPRSVMLYLIYKANQFIGLRRGNAALPTTSSPGRMRGPIESVNSRRINSAGVPLSEDQIQLAYRRLNEQGWLPVGS